MICSREGHACRKLCFGEGGVGGSVPPDAPRDKQALLFSRPRRGGSWCWPGSDVYSIPHFTTCVSFYTSTEEQWGLLCIKGRRGGLLEHKSVLLPTTKLLNLVLEFILIGLHFISIQVLNIYSRMIVLLPIVHVLRTLFIHLKFLFPKIRCTLTKNIISL